jgi:hypothetical protein
MTMTKLELLGAAVIIVAITAPASGQVGEPAAVESQYPNFSIYTGGGARWRPTISQPFNVDAMAQMQAPVRPYRPHRSPLKRN